MKVETTYVQLIQESRQSHSELPKTSVDPVLVLILLASSVDGCDLQR
jgi:hypothetical protein